MLKQEKHVQFSLCLDLPHDMCSTWSGRNTFPFELISWRSTPICSYTLWLWLPVLDWSSSIVYQLLRAEQTLWLFSALPCYARVNLIFDNHATPKAWNNPMGSQLSHSEENGPVEQAKLQVDHLWCCLPTNYCSKSFNSHIVDSSCLGHLHRESSPIFLAFWIT